MNENKPEDQDTPAREDRRGFFAKAIAVIAGGVTMLVPLGAGLAVLFDPVRRKSKANVVPVTLLSSLPEDGLPRLFPIYATRRDGWTLYPESKIGSIYLLRKPGDAKPTAFTATCPHLGCFINFSSSDNLFECPCHTSAFQLDGSRLRGDEEVAPRGMDSLEVELRKNKESDQEEVWVKFENFRVGMEEKIPVS